MINKRRVINLHLLLDFDNTLVSSDQSMHQYYQLITGDYSTTYSQDLAEWNMETLCPNFTQEMIDKMFISPLFFKLLVPYPETTEGLNRLMKMGCTLEVVSCHDIRGFGLKYNYIKENFPMINKITLLPHDNSKDINKSTVKGDIILDDNVKALDSSTCKHKVVFKKFNWNKDCNYDRVDNLLEFCDYVEKLQISKE